MSKSIDTLVPDIYDVFLKPHEISQENLDALGDNLKNCVKDAIVKAGEKRVPTLRMSVIGKPDRQIWYELNSKDTTKVTEFGDLDVFEPNPEKYLKFLFGNILEELLVFLIKESGHSFAYAQEEVNIDGVLGHTDGVIDRVVSDIKTSSSFQFRNKWLNRSLLKSKENDPFGYVGQIAGYHQELLKKYPDDVDPENVAWLVFNKETGELLLVKADTMELINAEDRVSHLKKLLSKTTPPPEKCFTESTHDNGNREIHKSCGYCAFKTECYKSSNNGQGLRKFKYSNGIKYLSHVNKLPKVEEII